MEFVVFLTVAAVALFLGYVYRDAIFRWMRRRHDAETAKNQRDRLTL
jgi:hypothetical protein